MTEDQALAAAVAAFVGFVVARPLLSLRLRAVPARLMRANYRGLEVPAAGGGPVVLAAVMALAVLTIAAAGGWAAAVTAEVGAAVLIALIVMHLAGAWDDTRGDERPRGFKGHLGAAKGGRVTGGLIKAIAGGAVGIACAALLTADFGRGILVALTIALSANLFNLLDRAPGRAAKVWIVVTVALMFAAPPAWTIAVAGLLGAVLIVLPADLGERVMLGDAGVNPMGAVAGIGLSLSATRYGLLTIALVLLGLNAAAEKWSFSRIVSANRLLSALDDWGRSRPEERDR